MDEIYSDGRYRHKGRLYSSFRAYAWIEGMKILLLLFAAGFCILLPLIFTGRLQRGIESFWFGTITTHYSSAPSGSAKESYIEMARQDAASADIPPDLFVRQIAEESGFNPNETSSAGAVGIAQFLPSTASGLGIDPYDPASALQGAAQLMARYQSNYGGDYTKALAAYNGGTGRLNFCIQNYGASWLSCEPADTRNYIYVIMG